MNFSFRAVSSIAYPALNGIKLKLKRKNTSLNKAKTKAAVSFQKVELSKNLSRRLNLGLQDICRNESISGVAFDHLFVEAGTGFMALALMLGMAWLEHPAVIHVLLLADHEDTFRDKLQRLHGEFVSSWARHAPIQAVSYCTNLPQQPLLDRLIKRLGKKSNA